MPRKRRRSSRRWVSTAVALVVLLAFAVYSPILNWWQSFPSTSKFLLLAGTGFVLMMGIGVVFAFLIYRKRERDKIWRLAMAGWQNGSRREQNRPKSSAMHLSDLELEKLAEQVYKKLGYSVQHVGQTGDHGIDVLLINPNNQKEIVQCKQWSKPVGEAALRDLYGAMMHDQAVRGWIWAPRGFSGPAKEWVKGKSIVLVDDMEINRLMGVAYKNK
ncbi:MAG TPA: restriction endonuclease [Anaerolineales bacterium]|nr:restriction endonuclease [Anaerolineales bacterium]